jgi:hypothetical protein
MCSLECVLSWQGIPVEVPSSSQRARGGGGSHPLPPPALHTHTQRETERCGLGFRVYVRKRGERFGRAARHEKHALATHKSTHTLNARTTHTQRPAHGTHTAHTHTHTTQVEMKPCTPLSDRVCVAAGPTVGSDGKIVPPPKYGDWHDTFLPAPK